VPRRHRKYRRRPHPLGLLYRRLEVTVDCVEKMGIRIKRASEPAADDDGTRVLVDRYWPRGVQRGDAHIDVWCHEVAPSPEAIAWYGRKRERWDEFKQRYWRELGQPASVATVEELRQVAAVGTLTLVYGARDKEFNGARALAEYLEPLVVEAATGGGAVVAPPQRLVPSTRPRRTRPPRFRLGSLLDWTWIFLGLATPLILLFTGEALVVWGQRALIALGCILGVVCASTVARVTIQERRTRQALGTMPPKGEGGVSILVPMQELGIAFVGYLLGFAALVLALVFVSMVARIAP
jgi:uncharacterized protein YeaO (DUF488 family)